MGKRPRIAFWGNFGTGNWGNECTLQAILSNARERVPQAELSCICSEPSDTVERHAVAAVPISYTRRQGGAMQSRRIPKPFRALRRAARELREWVRTVGVARTLDAVVMTGTGMLTDDSEGAFGLPYDLFKWAVAAKVCGSKVLFASVGVEPIESPIARFFIVTALRLADYRSYRDLQSQEHLKRVGFASARDRVYPDLAFSLPKGLASPGTNGPPPADARPRRSVAVGLYNYRGRGQASPADAAAYGDYLDTIGSFVMWLLEGGFAVRIIIGDLTYDEPVIGDLRRVLRDKGVGRFGDRLADEPAASVEDVMRQIAEVEVVVASRFHNVLLALLLGKPVVSIAYNEKNDALMTQMGLSRFCQSIDQLDLGRLIEQFTEIEANASTLGASIAAKGAAYRDRLDEQYQTVFATAGALPRREDSASSRNSPPATLASEGRVAERPGFNPK
jgi:polysaccharide pyruvyl transferase WcaK-like protein